ncbi:MAG TPA: GNAT family N-acetyltransferase [Gemmatimonadaceae bacterium]|jgi:ribosomal protein S18 acetylase RimI-like enzyme
MRIRLAVSDDAPRLFAVDPLASREAARAQLLEKSIESGACWVAEDGASILGYILRDYTFYGNAFVPLLVVAEQFRRRGIGERLLLHAVSTCATEKLFTSTNESNQAMRGLLAKVGFESSGVIYNLDEGDPELVFVRRVED